MLKGRLWYLVADPAAAIRRTIRLNARYRHGDGEAVRRVLAPLGLAVIAAAVRKPHVAPEVDLPSVVSPPPSETAERDLIGAWQLLE